MSCSKLKINTPHDPKLNDYYHIKQKLISLRPLLIELAAVGKETVPLLREISQNIKDVLERNSEDKMLGTVGSICGGVLSAVGFGLSFMTFGASLGISIAGTAIAGLGSGVVAIKSGEEIILSIISKKKAQKALAKYQELLTKVSIECIEIGDQLQSQADTDIWKDFWEHLLLGYKTAKAIKHVYWDAIAKTIRESLRLGGYFVDDAISTGAKVTGTVFRTLGRTGKVLHVAGGVLGIMFIPLDIYTFASLLDEDGKEKNNDATSKIDYLAKRIEDSCPKESEIDAMIQGTLQELWQRCSNQ